jgi:transcriptional regulator with XRE-family HTH domain
VPIRRISPTVGRRRLGIELRRLRDQAGITIEVVADRMECSSSKVSRIETGHIGASPRDVRDMLTIYGVDGKTADELVQLARDAKQKGWWQAYGQVLTGAYVGLEAAASRIRSYEAQVVPHLLQTPEYAREVITASRPDLSPEHLAQRLEVRDRRQAILTQEDPLDLWVILDEAALRRTVGGPALMRVQMERIISHIQESKVTLQILPFCAGAHAGMDGSFSILEYEEQVNPDVAFAENAAGGLFLEKEGELVRYRSIFEELRHQALPAERSVEMLNERVKELQNENDG